MTSSMQRDLRLVWLGIAGELRNPALRLMCVLAAVAAASFAWSEGTATGSAALVLAEWAGRGFSLAACLWFATGALRDQNSGLGAVLRSKPVDGGRWVLLNWATGLGIWLLVMGITFLGAAAGGLPAGGLRSLAAYLLAFGRAALTMLPLATLGFALTRLTRSPLGGSVVALALFCVIAGLQYVAPFLRPDYLQNAGLYFAAAAFLLALTAFLVERARRGELRRPLQPVLGTVGCLLLTAGGGNGAYHAADGPKEGSVPDMIARQMVQKGRRAPGFWLPDGKGGTVHTADYAGKILLIYLFPADDLEAARTLPALEWAQREYGKRGVQSLPVVLSPDHGAGAELALGGGYPFPLGIDLTTVKATSPPDSVVATAYNVSTLPLLIVTDRRRRVQDSQTEASYSQERLRSLIETRLAEEPE